MSVKAWSCVSMVGLAAIMVDASISGRGRQPVMLKNRKKK
jgi:hypothetical protein